MQTALVECGWHNYSLFYRARGGVAFGYFESDALSFGEACGRVAGRGDKANARWQAAMAKFTPDAGSPVDAAGELGHYFYLGTDRKA